MSNELVVPGRTNCFTYAGREDTFGKSCDQFWKVNLLLKLITSIYPV